MAIKTRDKEFRIPKTTSLEFKVVEMDRVLTMLFPRIKYDGYAGRRTSRTGDLDIELFQEEFLSNPDWFDGFDQFPDIVYKWIETDLMDVVNRGKANQAIAAPRPLHGNTYKFRNSKHARDYGTSEQIYWMLYYARRGKGQSSRDALKKFFFQAIDLVTDKYDDNASVDVETQAILRLDQQVKQDTKDTKEPLRPQPLCIGQADILADDMLRILAYEPFIPRSVMVEYIKTLLAFHLSLYQLKLMKILPKFVKQKCGDGVCDPSNCPVNPGFDNALQDCPYKVSLLVDIGDSKNSHMEWLAQKSAEQHYKQIPAFIQANFVVKKLDEMADYLGRKISKIPIPESGDFNVSELVSMLGPKYDGDRQSYFKSRLASLIEETTDGEEDVSPEIKSVIDMNLDEFDSFIEILMAYRSKFHQRYITQSLDSMMLKNKDTGILAQSRATRSPRKFVMGSKLLEVLLQIAVLSNEDGKFVTREIRIDNLLTFFQNRYGVYIDRLPDGDEEASILDRQALRLNAESFKKRLREIGFFDDLSDAYITQKVAPRYSIK